MWLGSRNPPSFGRWFAGKPLARVSEFEPITVTGSVDDPMSRRNLRARSSGQSAQQIFQENNQVTIE
jgi:hypothetical protein